MWVPNIDGEKVIARFNSMVSKLEENLDLELLEEEVDDLKGDLRKSEEDWKRVIEDLDEFEQALEQNDEDEAQKQALEIKMRAKYII